MQTQDMDIIKNGLQQIIDQMESLETNRILPDGHPNKTMAPDPTSADGSVSPDAGDTSSMPPEGDDSSAMDPKVLDELMNKASASDSEGSTPDDATEGLPPEIVAAVAKKKKAGMSL